jgi:hypothetical protein
MLESKILPTILIILPSSVFLLLAHPGVGKAAAEKCNTRPSSSAPQGAHWYYRVNHTDNRRCWFLSSEGMKVRSNARGAMSDVASDTPTPKRDNSSETASLIGRLGSSAFRLSTVAVSMSLARPLL